MRPNIKIALLCLSLCLPLAACNSPESTAQTPNPLGASNVPTPGPSNPPSGPVTTDPIPSPAPTGNPAYLADALIFNGNGVDTTGTQSIVKILTSHSLTYKTVTSVQFNAMSAEDLAKYRLLIWPGGSNAEMDASLTATARKNARIAVVEKGMNYVGFCAGAFIAVGPRVYSDGTPEYGLAIVDEAYLYNYRPASGSISMQWATFPDGSQRQLVLWNGPYFNWQEGVIARYSDGKGAIVQTQAGKGFVVLSGPHPEAPSSWAPAGGMTDQDGVDHALAWSLINAAHKAQPLPAY